MHFTIGPAALITVILLLCLSCVALAEVTMTTDKPSYVVGEVVEVTAHNSGPEDLFFDWYPLWSFWNVDTGECISWCDHLPLTEPFPNGGSIFINHDTGYDPDPPGTYRVELSMTDGPSVTYALTEAIPNEQSSWSTLKSRYR